MITIQRILCPTDLTTEADEALRYAVALSSVYNAKLFILYCREPGTNRNGNGGDAKTVEREPLFIDSLAPHLGLKSVSELNWEGLVAENTGDVGRTIVREAAKHEVDLIVMRSRRRPRAAALLGSTAETVFRTAPCSVLVTHPQEREWVSFSTGEIDLNRILVAHDFSADSELALKYGVSLAQEYQAELHLLHVLSKEERDQPEVAWTQASSESGYKNATLQLQAAIPKEAFLWCKIVNAVSCGNAYEEVLTYAKEHAIDLICMGAGGTRFILGVLFGSNTNRVLRRAPCPVLVARPKKTGVTQVALHKK
ncbi:MAG TPA: universal stress protein [Pyrinomonadaceae bacterium]|nr:universal stress protein [Pyrinomonadaceae bacterium]